jgi:shikimate dehydrogenase
MITPVQTDLFAVIGNPVKHSLSPAMMNALFERLSLPAVYVALQADELPKDLNTLAEAGFRGLSVTLPHKETAYRLAAKVDEKAEAIGAVNTLRRFGTDWEACNTDWVGANRALQRVTELKGKRALILGAGGVARAVAFGLKEEMAEVTISNRGLDRGISLAKAFQSQFIPLDELGRTRSQSFEVVVQCTSVGLAGAESAVLAPMSFFHADMVVMDTVYRPLWTPFLNAAREAGCIVVPGIDMLLYQGVAQVEWWFERPIPQAGIQVMREALMSALKDEGNDQKN